MAVADRSWRAKPGEVAIPGDGGVIRLKAGIPAELRDREGITTQVV